MSNCGYCERVINELPATYMVYNVLDEISNIIKIIKITFVNEYDSNGKFVRTICGKTPDAITEEVNADKAAEEEKAKRELKDFINYFR